MKKDIIQVAIGIIAILGTILGSMNYFAKAADLKLVEFRLEQKIVSDQIVQMQQRLWQLEDRNYGADCSQWRQSEKEEYRILKEKVEFLKNQQQREDKMRKR